MPNLKRARWLAASAAGLVLLGAGVALAQSASSFDLSFNVIAAGGGPAAGSDAGGSYSLNGTIAQPIAGSSGGGAFDLNSGYQGSGGQKYKRFLPQLANDGS